MLGTSNDVQDRPLTWPLSADARTASQRRLNGLRTALFAEMGQRVRAELGGRWRIGRLSYCREASEWCAGSLPGG